MQDAHDIYHPQVCDDNANSHSDSPDLHSMERTGIEQR